MKQLKHVLLFVLAAVANWVGSYLAREHSDVSGAAVCVIWALGCCGLYRVNRTGIAWANGKRVDRKQDPEAFEKHFGRAVLVWLFVSPVVLFILLSGAADFAGWLAH